MADRRVRIARDKAELVKRLTPSGSDYPPFKSYAAAVAFAAAYGVAKDAFAPVVEPCKEVEPIRVEIFRNQNLFSVIELIALYRSGNPNILSDELEMEEKRVSVFESFANGGFELIAKKCEGVVEPLDAISLMISKRIEDEGEEGIPLYSL